MNERVRMKMLLAGTASTFLFCGCSLRVLTEVRADYPAQSAERVMVYGTDEAVPEGADTVGSIRVLDSGLTTKCRYAQVLQMAAERTAACGGNALHIDAHSQPNFWSNCHRLNGTMLRVPERVVTATTRQEIQRMEALQDEAEAARMLEKSMADEERPRQMLRVSVGPSWITSRVYVTQTRFFKGRRAIDVYADYEYQWRKGWGLGANFAYNRASFGSYGSFTQTYLGPSLLYAYRRPRRIGMEIALGLGVGYYAELGGYTAFGMGMQSRLGVEYLFTKHFGIGLQLISFSCYYPKPKEAEIVLKENEEYRLDRVSVQLGLQYYF